jgi:hypothetical protein
MERATFHPEGEWAGSWSGSSIPVDRPRAMPKAGGGGWISMPDSMITGWNMLRE